MKESKTNILSTTIGGISLDCCIYNASGPRTGSIDALEKVGASASGAILAKSATLIKQSGNTMPRFINKVDLGSYGEGALNSEGLPNCGIDYYINEEHKSRLSVFKKPFFLSISGHSLFENVTMIEHIYKNPTSVAGIELNLACPNIASKPVISNDFEQMNDMLDALTKHPHFKTIPFGVKLGPYIDLQFCEQAAEVICKYPVSYVVTCNSLGNALFVDAEKECEAIAANEGLGGLSGGFIKHTALANVHLIRTFFDLNGRSDIDIVGVGGVQTGLDAFELILCGAKAVQVGTCHWSEGPSCFSRISQELAEIMTHKGYTSINQFCGKLKSYIKPTTTDTGVHTLPVYRRNSFGKDKSLSSSTLTMPRRTSSSSVCRGSDSVGSSESVNIGSMALHLFSVLLGAAIVSIFTKIKALLGQ